jgi:hypothetical protein
MDFEHKGWKCRQNCTFFYSWQRWIAVHPSYDGAPDSPHRNWFVMAENETELRQRIEEWEEE